MPSSAPNRNKVVQPIKKVGTLNVTVTGDQDVTKVCHKILAFIKTVDRQGVVQVFVNGKETKGGKKIPKPTDDPNNLLD